MTDPAPDPATQSACRGFHQLSLADTDWAGGKGANLGELTTLGMAVPSGFVIGAPAYREFAERTGLRAKLAEALAGLDPEDSEQLAAVAATTHELSIQTSIPHSIASEISAAYGRLNSGESDRPVAVRSSAIGEDAATTSFAGMHASFLNVHGEQELLHAVRRCWASLFTERTIYYRATQDLPLADMDIAVVVQKQLAAKRSGVMFTIDPTTGRDDRVVVEASVGLGEAVVSGSVSPDHFAFAKGEDFSLMLVEKKISRKEMAIDPLPQGGTQERKLTDYEATHSAILESEAQQIAHTGLAIERHYGQPQDIEWALDAAGALWILQSRPITTAGGGTPADLKTERGVLLSGVGAGPGAATGAVRLIESLKQASLLRDGELLVAHTTRPDWVPLMRRAGGIITDTGGITCHAAIVARELGIPTIVGTGNATAKLVDGQVVTIDAAAGNVLSGARRVEQRATEANLPAQAPVDDGSKPREPAAKTRTKILVNLSDPDQIERARRHASAAADRAGARRGVCRPHV